jgi:peptidoglycan/xylan/chitin deacetylase (PgdA/CDA1 family)
MSIYGKRGVLVRLLYLMGAMVWYVLSLGGRLGRGEVVVLCYHGIRDDQCESFRWQMSRVSGKTVETTNPARMEALPTMAQPKILITFDDAFANLLDNALPALEEYRIPAIVFAVADNLGKMPCWEMSAEHPESNQWIVAAEELVSLGKDPLMRIGSHTLTHSDLTKIPTDQIKTELGDSKEQLEELLGCTVEDMALPHGGYNEKVLTMAKEAGYKRVYTLDPKATNFESGSLVVGRFSMSPDVWKIEFMLTCAGAYAWLYPWRAGLASIRRKIGRRDRSK